MSFINPKDYSNFDVEKIIFEPAKQIQGDHGQKFSRKVLKYNYDNGTLGPLVIQTPILYTYGVTLGSFTIKKENAAPQMSLVTFNPEIGPTHEEQLFLNVCNSILVKIKEHLNLVSVKEELGKWDMEADVNSMKVFYVKMEKGRPVKGYPPILYAKLYYCIEGGEVIITSRIADATTGEKLPQKPYLGRGKVYATIIFSNIYIGHKPSIQLRIGEIMVVENNEKTHFLEPLTQKTNHLSEISIEPNINDFTITNFKVKSLIKPKKNIK